MLAPKAEAMPCVSRFGKGTFLGLGKQVEGEWWELGKVLSVVLFLEAAPGVGSVCELGVYAGCAFLYVAYASIKHFKSIYSLTTLLCVVGKQGHSPKAHKINYVTAV